MEADEASAGTAGLEKNHQRFGIFTVLLRQIKNFTHLALKRMRDNALKRANSRAAAKAARLSIQLPL